MKKFMFVLLSVLLVFAVCSCATTAKEDKVNYPLTYVLTEDTYSTLSNAMFDALNLPEEKIAEYGGADAVKKVLSDQLVEQLPAGFLTVSLVDEQTITVVARGNEDQKASYKLEEGVLSVDWEGTGAYKQLAVVSEDFSVMRITTTNISGFNLPLYLAK